MSAGQVSRRSLFNGDFEPTLDRGVTGELVTNALVHARSTGTGKDVWCSLAWQESGLDWDPA